MKGKEREGGNLCLTKFMIWGEGLCNRVFAVFWTVFT
jgi:hypothetical protein